MLELSFELGIPAHELARRLPERVFRRYQVHAATWMLPTRRLQMQLAKLAMLVDMRMGVHPAGAEFRLSDYLFDPEDEVDPAQAAREAFGFNPIKKKG